MEGRQSGNGHIYHSFSVQAVQKESQLHWRRVFVPIMDGKTERISKTTSATIQGPIIPVRETSWSSPSRWMEVWAKSPLGQRKKSLCQSAWLFSMGHCHLRAVATLRKKSIKLLTWGKWRSLEKGCALIKECRKRWASFNPFAEDFPSAFRDLEWKRFLLIIICEAQPSYDDLQNVFSYSGVPNILLF